jgi:hypothetical protein
MSLASIIYRNDGQDAVFNMVVYSASRTMAMVAYFFDVEEVNYSSTCGSQTTKGETS